MEPGQMQPAGTSSERRSTALADEVQELVWAMLDERVSAAEIARLERLITAQPRARAAYIHCMAMHAELRAFFARSEPLDAPLPIVAPLAIDGLAAPELHPRLSGT